MRGGGSGSSHSKTTSSLRGSFLQSKIDYAQMPPVYKIPLYLLDFYYLDVRKKQPPNPILLKDAIQKERRAQGGGDNNFNSSSSTSSSICDVTLVFAIRQVG